MMKYRSLVNSNGSRLDAIVPLGMLAALILAAGGCGNGPSSGTSDGCISTPTADETISFTEGATGGFDEDGTPGANLGVAVNAAEDEAIVIAMQFINSPGEKSFTPSCDINASRESYAGDQQHARLEGIWDDFSWIRSGLTLNQDILDMKYDFVAFYFQKNGGDTRAFMALDGDLTMTRNPSANPPTVTVTGDLTFVAMTGLTEDAEFDADADLPRTLSFPDISFSWDADDATPP